MEKRVSIKDIARQVGVSAALVSYVLNNKSGRVSVEMAEKIRTVAADLHYRPNFIARSLQSGRSNTLGLIVADISNPFFSHIARIIEDEAKQSGYTVIFGSSDERVDKSQDLIDALLNRQVDALIIAPAEFTGPQIKTLQEKGIPVVLIDRYFPELSAASVRIDNFKAAYAAVDYLAATGSRRVAMMAYDTGMEHIAQRISGYRHALSDHGIVFEQEWLLRASYYNLEKDVELLMKKLLYPRPQVDAIFFATNSLAVEGLRQIMRFGVRVPETISLISFDEADAFDFFYAPISYVRQSIEDMGKEAVRLAMEGIAAGRGKTRNGGVMSAGAVGDDRGMMSGGEVTHGGGARGAGAVVDDGGVRGAGAVGVGSAGDVADGAEKMRTAAARAIAGVVKSAGPVAGDSETMRTGAVVDERGIRRTGEEMLGAGAMAEDGGNMLTEGMMDGGVTMPDAGKDRDARMAMDIIVDAQLVIRESCRPRVKTKLTIKNP